MAVNSSSSGDLSSSSFEWKILVPSWLNEPSDQKKRRERKEERKKMVKKGPHWRSKAFKRIACRLMAALNADACANLFMLGVFFSMKKSIDWSADRLSIVSQVVLGVGVSASLFCPIFIF